MNNKQEYIYIVCYGDSDKNGRGLAVLDFDRNQGIVGLQNLIATYEKPGGVIVFEHGLWLAKYDEATKKSEISIYQKERDGELKLKRTDVVPYFFSSFHQAGSWVLASSFKDGVDAVININTPGVLYSTFKHPYTNHNATDSRQKTPHSHFVTYLCNKRKVLSTDMGNDDVFLFDFERADLSLDTTLSFKCPAGSGPRLMPVAKNEKFAYLLLEIKNEVVVYRIEDESFTPIQNISVVSPGFHGINSPAACTFDESGRRLIVSNRGEDSLVLFEVDQNTGLISISDRVKCGKTPRDAVFLDHFVVVTAQEQNEVEVFALDVEKRRLTKCNTALHLNNPVCIYQ